MDYAIVDWFCLETMEMETLLMDLVECWLTLIILSMGEMSILMLMRDGLFNQTLSAHI